MKRWLIFILLLSIAAVIAAGCGGSGETASTNDTASQGGVEGQADAAACSANRRMISSASQQYFSMEGAYPASIQVLVPGYLQSVPACPSGGTYRLQGSSVTCSVHGK